MTVDGKSGPMGSKMALRRFVMRAAGGFRGRKEGEMFARELLGCFSNGEVPAEVTFGHSFPEVDAGKRGSRTVSAYWAARRVVVEVVERDMMLDLAWSELLRACLQMEIEPQYVVLTNQRDLRLYDLSSDRAVARLPISLDELPKYSEAFPFFEPVWAPGTTPKIISVDKVSKEVADLVARLYRALKAQNPKRGEDVIRFTLQCIIAMFAEDIGLLPKEYFTTLLYRAAEEGGATEKLGELFRQMATPPKSGEKNDSGIPYFNGGLFTDPVTLELGEAPLKALTKASEANWTFVDPHIFGSVFQGIMDSAERHASGAHYTAREDIMSVVGPTIVEPWRERIGAAKTLKDLREILTALSTYKVLDPACGSGNFLYVAFRELYKLESDVLRRIYEFTSVQKGSKISWASGIRTTNFYGIDINPFAVELAKTTLNIAKKIAFDERRDMVVETYAQRFLEVDPSLPLDNLDKNVIRADALLTDWAKVDAIVGNPPFLSASKAQAELGRAYLNEVRKRFPTVPGRADFCTYFFRKTHDSLASDGRAGLVGTNTIRQNVSREGGLDYILAQGGTITRAVATQPWSGNAAVHVSIVNWVKGSATGPFSLEWQDDDPASRQRVTLTRIPSSLSHTTDLTGASTLATNSTTKLCFQGQTHGHEGFLLPITEAGSYLPGDGKLPPVLHPLMIANDLLGPGAAQRYVIDFSGLSLTQASEHRALFEHVRKTVKADREEAAANEAKDSAVALKANPKARTNRHHANFLSKWWQLSYARGELMASLATRQRYVACGRVTKRPIFAFVSTAIHPGDSLTVFLMEDDYGFGVLSSSMHWRWFNGRCSTLKGDPRYTSESVFDSFPWPQEPALSEVVAVAAAARALRATRDRLMAENGWSLRELYQSAEVAGPHPLKEAQAALDAAVEAAYGKPADQEATAFLLEMNLALAEDEAAGRTIQGPGLPKGLDPKDPRWFSTDCIEPPPLPGTEAGA